MRRAPCDMERGVQREDGDEYNQDHRGLLRNIYSGNKPRSCAGRCRPRFGVDACAGNHASQRHHPTRSWHKRVRMVAAGLGLFCHTGIGERGATLRWNSFQGRERCGHHRRLTPGQQWKSAISHRDQPGSGSCPR